MLVPLSTVVQAESNYLFNANDSQMTDLPPSGVIMHHNDFFLKIKYEEHTPTDMGDFTMIFTYLLICTSDFLKNVNLCQLIKIMKN